MRVNFIKYNTCSALNKERSPSGAESGAVASPIAFFEARLRCFLLTWKKRLYIYIYIFRLS